MTGLPAVAVLPQAKDVPARDAAQPQETTAFISYWRPDEAVVQKLAAALAEVGVTATGDWQLAGGTPFRDVLADRITSASLVVLMLTPELVRSAECAKEVAHARRLGKRIAPVLLRRVLPADAGEIEAINWIPWSGDDEGRGVAARLREAIDKDFDWEREHTWLALREESWARSGRKRSYSLRRADLRQAESWIARAGANRELTPRPTDAIIDFVAKSRRDEKTAQAIFFTVIVAVLLVVIAMAAYALRQAQARTDAERERATIATQKLAAERKAEAARRLAEQRRLETETQKSIAAVNAENALREQLRQTEETGRQILNDGKITEAAPYLAHVYSQRAANARLGPTGALRFMIARAIAPLEGRRVVLSSHAVGARSIVFSPDASLVATAGDDGDLVVWDAKSGTVRYSFGPHEKSAMIGAAFSPDGRYVFAYESRYQEAGDPEVTGSYREHVTLAGAAEGNVIEEYEAQSGETDPGDVGIDAPRFSADGRAFTFDFDLDSGDGPFSIADGQELDDPSAVVIPERTRPRTAPAPPCSEEVPGRRWTSADGSLIIDRNGAIHRAADCAWLTMLEGSGPLRAATFSRDNRIVGAAYADGAVLWEWRKARPALLAQWSSGGHSAAFADATATKILIHRDGAVEQRDTATGRVLSAAPVDATDRVRLLPLTERFLVERDEAAELRDAITGKTLAKLEVDPGEVSQNDSGGTAPEVLQFDPATQQMMIKYPQQWDVVAQTIWELRDLRTGAVASSTKTLGDDFDAVATNWKHDTVFTASRNGQNASMWINSLGDWNPYYLREAQPFDSATAAEFLPDAKTVLVAAADGKVRFYDSRPPRPDIRTRLSDAKKIAVSRDGRYALIGNDRSTEIVDLHEHRSIVLCSGAMSGDRWSMSADSRTAVTTGPDAAMRVWDLETGRLLATMRLPGEPSPARFSEDGTRIVVQAGRFTQVWNARPESRPPQVIAQQVARLLPLRLEGDRLVPRN